MSIDQPIDMASATPLTSAALGHMLQARAEQIFRYGHTADKDDQAGPAPLIAAARCQLLKALQVNLRDADNELQAAGDMAMGNIAQIDEACLNVLYARAIRAGAICLALAELIDRERAAR